MRFAVIDLGTNTFHLLIAERNAEGGWMPVVRERIFVKLADAAPRASSRPSKDDRDCIEVGTEP